MSGTALEHGAETRTQLPMIVCDAWIFMAIRKMRAITGGVPVRAEDGRNEENLDRIPHPLGDPPFPMSGVWTGTWRRVWVRTCSGSALGSILNIALPRAEGAWFCDYDTGRAGWVPNFFTLQSVFLRKEVFK